MGDGTRYMRVSTLASLYSDDMRHAVAQMTAQGAVRVMQEQLATFGTLPDWPTLQKAIHGEYTRQDQATKDRGTVVNLLFDAMNAEGWMAKDDALGWVESRLDEERGKANSEWEEYMALVKAGLWGDDPKPARGYQCSIDDVSPFVQSLSDNWKAIDFTVTHPQLFLKSDRAGRHIAGTSDGVGHRRERPTVAELKTKGSGSSISRSWRAQLACYCNMVAEQIGETPSGLMIIVTPEAVVLRELSETGFFAGLLDITEAYDILSESRKSVKGSFKSARQTNKEVES